MHVCMYVYIIFLGLVPEASWRCWVDINQHTIAYRKKVNTVKEKEGRKKGRKEERNKEM